MASQSAPFPLILWPLSRQDRLALERAQEVVNEAKDVLRRHPKPDTFLGRKTQEPFPQEEN